MPHIRVSTNSRGGIFQIDGTEIDAQAKALTKHKGRL